jgi:hypothetical protein
MLHHFMSVVEYGHYYLEAETLSCVEKYIHCLLYCKKRFIDNIICMFFIRVQESA